jgi:hypothetical protein
MGCRGRTMITLWIKKVIPKVRRMRKRKTEEWSWPKLFRILASFDKSLQQGIEDEVMTDLAGCCGSNEELLKRTLREFPCEANQPTDLVFDVNEMIGASDGIHVSFMDRLVTFTNRPEPTRS